LASRQAVAMIFMIANARPPRRWNPLPARPFYPRNADPIGSANRRGPSADGTESSNAVLMSEISAAIATSALGLNSLEDYEPLIGAAATQRILEKARRLRTLHAVYISSTFYGGGVTEILTPLTLMMNAMGIETGWRMIQGTPAFFGCTKKLHNTLKGEAIDLSDTEKAIYEQVVFENAIMLPVEDCDTVIVHDPHPLPLVRYFDEDREAPWIWQCHIDLTDPDPAVFVQLLKDGWLRERLGRRARETVRERFLMSRLVEDWIDLLAMLEGRPRHAALGRAGA